MTGRRRVTPAEAAALLGVPTRAIADWKHHRRVTPIDHARGRGRRVPVYYLEELEPLAAEYLARQTRRQKP